MSKLMAHKHQEILNSLNVHLKEHPGVAREPDWIMKIMQGETVLTKSDDQGETSNKSAAVTLAHYCPIYHYELGLTRSFNKESMSNDLTPSGLCAHELKIVVPFASIGPDVHLAFSQNTILSELDLARLATVSHQRAAAPTTPIACISKYTFKHLYITGLVSRYDLICMSFRYTDIKYFKHSINPKTGTHNGSEATSYHNLANSGGE